MNPPRPVFLTRRFWPCFDGAARSIADLAAGLVERGTASTVLAAQDHPQWPGTIRCRGVVVERIAPRPGDCRGEIHYARALTRWLRTHRDRYDVVCVSSLGEDAMTAIRAVGRDVPVVLRAERAGRHGDCFGQIESRRARRIKRVCLEADAMVGTSRRTEQELIAAGYPRKRIRRIEHGVAVRPPKTAQSRAAARRALAASSPALDLPEQAPLVVYAGRLDPSKGLELLLAAFGPIAARWPEAQLWLAGDGPLAGTLSRQFYEGDSGGHVMPIGLFDSIEILLDAADLFVLPSPEEDLSVALLEAMAAGLPVVAVDIPGNREVIVDGQHGLLVPPGDAVAFTRAITRLLKDATLSAAISKSTQAHVAAHFSLARVVNAYTALFATTGTPPR